ncbi:hypothetical protein [Paraburkholderia terrae]|uniref:Uncharacterized protein n=1 Tax=Paraburkholderia terrae TaxID=311230 RepID=A0A2I8EZX8_9BURK|nr:hypothetical protein [Paraburkholderia terrae]AUT65020.1 hypothetical protein C2L65_36120 [Paraburkholderia terrae]
MKEGIGAQVPVGYGSFSLLWEREKTDATAWKFFKEREARTKLQGLLLRFLLSGSIDIAQYGGSLASRGDDVCEEIGSAGRPVGYEFHERVMQNHISQGMIVVRASYASRQAACLAELEPFF